MSWNNEPPQPGQNPYAAPPARPGWTRQRVLIPSALVVLFIGIGTSGSDTNAKKAADAKPLPAATVTTTATATLTAEPTATVTAKAKPAPTVTKTVRVTVTPAVTDDSNADDSFSDGSESGGSSTYYANCSAVRAAGAAPIHRGDPGYGSHLDRDGDGVACE